MRVSCVWSWLGLLSLIGMIGCDAYVEECLPGPPLWILLTQGSALGEERSLVIGRDGSFFGEGSVTGGDGRCDSKGYYGRSYGKEGRFPADDVRQWERLVEHSRLSAYLADPAVTETDFEMGPERYNCGDPKSDTLWVMVSPSGGDGRSLTFRIALARAVEKGTEEFINAALSSLDASKEIGTDFVCGET